MRPQLERKGLSQRGRAFDNKAGLLQRGIAYNIYALPLKERQCLSQNDRESHREAGPFTETQGLSERSRVSHRETGPLTEKQVLSQIEKASHREAEASYREVGACHKEGYRERQYPSQKAEPLTKR